MSSADISSISQTVLSHTIATFPVIDTDTKKLHISEALRPVIDLFVDADYAFYHDLEKYALCRILDNFYRFVEFIKTDVTTFNSLLEHIQHQYTYIKKHYDEAVHDARQSFCAYGCPMCCNDSYPMETLLDYVFNSRKCIKNDKITREYSFMAYDTEDTMKNVMSDDRDKKNFYHAKKDIPRHNRNKGVIGTKTRRHKTVPGMKSGRYNANDFFL